VAVVEVFLVLAAGVGLAGVALAPDALAGTALVVACCSSLVASRMCLPAVAVAGALGVELGLTVLVVVEAVGLGAAGLAEVALVETACCSSL
jgi:hypothetical protein